jgi:hypothetical protein
MHEYDKSSKWLLQNHGDSILRLAGRVDFRAWRPLQAELVQPRRLPDGLLEVWPDAGDETDLSLVEIATYAEPRLGEQIARNAMLVYLARGIVPDVICLVLRPRGRRRAPRRIALKSRNAATRCLVAWPIIELWKIPSQDLLRSDDIGLIPWVPLSRLPARPEPVFQQCREMIDRKAPEGEHDNLLTVTQILASLRYNDPRVFEILGGKRLMIESPLLKQIVDEATQEARQQARQQARQEAIIQFLESKFGAVSPEIAEKIRTAADEAQLGELTRAAARCATLDEFATKLD